MNTPDAACYDVDGDGVFDGPDCTGELDCDDDDPSVYQDVVLYTDLDGDGYTVGTEFLECVGEMENLPEGATAESLGLDCNDDDENVWREELLYIDVDGDGYGNGEGQTCFGIDIPDGWSETSLGGRPAMMRRVRRFTKLVCLWTRMRMATQWGRKKCNV